MRSISSVRQPVKNLTACRWELSVVKTSTSPPQFPPNQYDVCFWLGLDCIYCFMCSNMLQCFATPLKLPYHLGQRKVTPHFLGMVSNTPTISPNGEFLGNELEDQKLYFWLSLHWSVKMGVSSNEGTPIQHPPFVCGIFHEKNHSAIGAPHCMEPLKSP